MLAAARYKTQDKTNPIRVAFCLALFFTLTVSLKAQVLLSGSREKALANSTLDPGTVWSVFQNPASLAQLNKPQAGVFFESRYMVKDLSQRAVCVALPIKGTLLGAGYQVLGNQLYRSSETSATLAKQLFRRWYAGITLTYDHRYIAQGYDSRDAFSFDAGVVYKASRQLTLAAHTSNPTQVRLSGPYREPAGSLYRVGAAWWFDELAQLTLSAQSIDGQTITPQAGLEARLHKCFVLRGGYNGAYKGYTFGFGCRIPHVDVDIGFENHRTFGLSPSITLTLIK